MGSSTDCYRKCFQKKGLANTGVCAQGDVVFCSFNGERAGALRVSNVAISNEILKAIAAGVVFVADCKFNRREDRKPGSYNTGERDFAVFLVKHNFLELGDTGTWIKADRASVQLFLTKYEHFLVDEARCWNDLVGFFEKRGLAGKGATKK